MLTVLLADGCLLIRLGLKQLLNEEYSRVCYGEAKTGAEALERVSKRSWDLIVLDVALPDQDSFSVLRQIYSCAYAGRPRVLMMSLQPDALAAARAYHLGASGYVAKTAGRRLLLKAVGKVLADQTHFNGALLRKAGGKKSDTIAGELRTTLSNQEYKVMQGLTRGKRIMDLAAELNLNLKTVSTYKRRIFDKLHLKSPADLIRYGMEQGLF